jgi:predicted ribosomally synthesized peptide with SipW-like signal peptide
MLRAAQRSHRAVASVRRPLFSPANLAKAIGVLTAAILAGVFLSGGTFAYLNATDALPSATIKAGSATLTTTGSPLVLTGLYPGSTQSAAFTINNTGIVPLILNVSGVGAPAADANSLSAALTIRVDMTTAAAGCSTLPGTPGWQSTFAATLPTATTPVSLNSTLAPGASATLCLSASLPLNAPSAVQGGTTKSFSVTIGGVQS